jgi:hypothetical protein
VALVADEGPDTYYGITKKVSEYHDGGKEVGTYEDLAYDYALYESLEDLYSGNSPIYDYQPCKVNNIKTEPAAKVTSVVPGVAYIRETRDVLYNNEKPSGAGSMTVKINMRSWRGENNDWESHEVIGSQTFDVLNVAVSGLSAFIDGTRDGNGWEYRLKILSGDTTIDGWYGKLSAGGGSFPPMTRDNLTELFVKHNNETLTGPAYLFKCSDLDYCSFVPDIAGCTIEIIVKSMTA